ncbi:MAG: hypothetical protein K8S99_12380 [Planctomycetes bacterium]|nr:hypothetical protein [Planctomycetota bacterium]
MGGFGSGRWSFHDKRITAEECCVLDANWMTRKNILRPGRVDNGTIHWSDTLSGKETSSIRYEVNTPARWLRLLYGTTDGREHFDYRVTLTTTTLPWGGARWWFICPLVKDGRPCNRRVGKLYHPPNGRYFGCRLCYNLTYQSCNESHQFDSILARLAASTLIDPVEKASLMDMLMDDYP